MSEKKIVVPEGMLKAALTADFGYTRETACWAYLSKALEWLSENPIVPTEEQETEMDKWARTRIPVEPIRPSTFAVEWQRRMFVEPEPEMIGSETVAQFCSRYRTIGAAAIEAYHLGQRNPK